MPLPPPVPRQKRHRRTLTMEGFFREDGLIEVEGHLVDQKAYDFESDWRGTVTAGSPVHDMWIRLTLDEHLTVKDVAVAMDAGPHPICPAITPAFSKLIGERIKPGWNIRVRELLGGVQGCTHLVEMLGPLGTVAYQTVGPSRVRAPNAPPPDPNKPPARIGQCHAFAPDGPIVKKRWPQFYTGS
jgi:hypothetical protein